MKRTEYNFGRLCLVKIKYKLLLFPIKGPAKRSIDRHIHVCV